MKFDKFTLKAQEAMAITAESDGRSLIRYCPLLHLLYALLEDNHGMPTLILNKLAPIQTVSAKWPKAK